MARKSDINVKLGLNSAGFTRGIEKVDDQLNAFQKQTKKLGSMFGGLGVGLASAFTIGAIKNYTQEAIRLAGQAEGIERAFDKLDSPTLLDDLRKATRGTVSDLELMRSAVRAENFQVPIEKMGMFFQFATQRSIETGESVDYLVNSIVDGIGRKSTLVMDNLGISATQLQEEIKKTGDFGLASANIIERELAESGVVMDSAATSSSRLDAALENLSVTLGEKLTPAAEKTNNILAETVETFNTSISQKGLIAGFFDAVMWGGMLGKATKGTTDEIKKQQHEQKKTTEETKRAALTVEEYIKINQKAFDIFSKNADASKQLREEQEKLKETFKEVMDSFKKSDSNKSLDPFSAEIEAMVDELEQRDAEAAEAFDTLEQSINDKKANWQLEDLVKQLEDVEKKLTNVQTVYNSINGVVSQIMTNSQAKTDNEIRGLDAEIEALNQKYNLERDRVMESIQNSRLRGDRINEIEEQRKQSIQQKEQQITKLRNKELRKQAIANKLTAITESIINTAVAVTKALPNIPLAAIIGGLGGAQTGLIASQSIPSFYTGGMFSGGMALVGERGPELIKTSGATSVYNSRQTSGMLGGARELVAEIDSTKFRIWLKNVERKNNSRIQ